MKYCLTGSSGFLGQVILKTLPYSMVTTLGRSGCDIQADLTISVPQLPLFDIIIHAAGKAHSVPRTAAERKAFYDVNVQGTSNLLEALSLNPVMPRSFVFVSTVAVYGKESGHLINENTALCAADAYGDSKIQAEHLIQTWCEKNDVICTILRLPLIAGANPPGNLKAMISGIQKGYYFNIAGGKARKSMVLAEDVAVIIPYAAQMGGIYNLSDGYHPSFGELARLLSSQLGKKAPFNIPRWLAVIVAKMGDLGGKSAPFNSSKLGKILFDLTFDDSKARILLQWNPRPVLEGLVLKKK